MTAAEIQRKINEAWKRYWDASAEDKGAIWAEIIELQEQLKEAKQKEKQ